MNIEFPENQNKRSSQEILGVSEEAGPSPSLFKLSEGKMTKKSTETFDMFSTNYSSSQSNSQEGIFSQSARPTIFKGAFLSQEESFDLFGSGPNSFSNKKTNFDLSEGLITQGNEDFFSDPAELVRFPKKSHSISQAPQVILLEPKEESVTVTKEADFSSSDLKPWSSSSVLDPLVLQPENGNTEFPYVSCENLAQLLLKFTDSSNTLQAQPLSGPSPIERKAQKVREPSSSQSLSSKASSGQASKRSSLFSHKQFTFDQVEEDKSEDGSSQESVGSNCSLPPGIPLKMINGSPNLPVDPKALSVDKVHKLVVIDCRYSYEYEGGHISSSINIFLPSVMKYLVVDCQELLKQEAFLDLLIEKAGGQVEGGVNIEMLKEIEKTYFKQKTEGKASREAVPVFVLHCEFSSQRGPNMFRFIRSLDREVMIEKYPALNFPQMFVLKGGYERFVGLSGLLCQPPMHYRPMIGKETRNIMRQEESRLAEEWKLLNQRK